MNFKKMILVVVLVLQAAAVSAENKRLLLESPKDFDQTFGLEVASIQPIDEIDNEFVIVDDGSKPTVETSDKATVGMDWQFEIYNNSAKIAHIALRADSQLVLPSSPENTLTLPAGQFFQVLPYKSVRVAGLDKSALYRLIVLDRFESKNESFSADAVERIKKQGRARVFNIYDKPKAFYRINSDFSLKDLHPSARILQTLPLFE